MNPCPAASFIILQESPFTDIQYIMGNDRVSHPFDYKNIVELDTKVDCGKINFEFIDENGELLNEKIFQVEED